MMKVHKTSKATIRGLARRGGKFVMASDEQHPVQCDYCD